MNLLQESPVHHLALIQSLIDMVSLKSRRPCMIALDALRDLFAKVLLAPERKLRTFSQVKFTLQSLLPLQGAA